MLGHDAKALQPLLRVVASNGLPASDQMSAILVAGHSTAGAGGL